MPHHTVQGQCDAINCNNASVIPSNKCNRGDQHCASAARGSTLPKEKCAHPMMYSAGHDDVHSAMQDMQRAGFALMSIQPQITTSYR